MKTIFKIASLSCLCFTLLLSCETEPKHDGYIISGSITGVDDGWIKITRRDFKERGNVAKVIDSAQISNGKFQLKGKVDFVDIAGVTINDTYRSMGGFMLENSDINLSVDIATADKYGQIEPHITGSASHDRYIKQDEISKRIFSQEKYMEMDKVREEMSIAYKSKDEERIASVKKRLEPFNDLASERQKEYQNSKIDYVMKNPSLPESPYVLSFQFSEGRMDKETLKKVYNAFQGEAKKTSMFQYYEKTYTEIFESLGVGATAPDFSLKTLQGDDLKLSEVKGKVILVDFWASWCVPCRASFPHLKELYGKYKKDGFEILAVGAADIGDNWKRAIEEDQTVWNHVFDGDVNLKREGKSAPYGAVAKLYSVPFLPTTFLLDENLKILGRNLPKKELDKKLEELFGY